MENVTIYDNVILGRNVVIEEFCIIGKPPGEKENGELPTVIGDNAVIRSHTVIYAGNHIGNNFRTGHHVVIREENRIGHNVSVGTLSCVEHHISIEDDVRIHSQVFIPEFSILKKEAWIGPNVVITNARYPRSKGVKDSLVGADIGVKAKIGANVTLLPGIKIGDSALVGAGSVVVRDVPSRMVAAGNPAKILKSIDEIPEYS